MHRKKRDIWKHDLVYDIFTRNKILSCVYFFLSFFLFELETKQLDWSIHCDKNLYVWIVTKKKKRTYMYGSNKRSPTPLSLFQADSRPVVSWPNISARTTSPAALPRRLHPWYHTEQTGQNRFNPITRNSRRASGRNERPSSEGYWSGRTWKGDGWERSAGLRAARWRWSEEVVEKWRGRRDAAAAAFSGVRRAVARDEESASAVVASIGQETRRSVVCSAEEREATRRIRNSWKLITPSFQLGLSSFVGSWCFICVGFLWSKAGLDAKQAFNLNPYISMPASYCVALHFVM